MCRFARIAFYGVLLVPPFLLWLVVILSGTIAEWAAEKLESASHSMEVLAMTPILNRMWNRNHNGPTAVNTKGVERA